MNCSRIRNLFHFAAALGGLVVLSSAARADVVEIAGGSVVQGKVLSTDGGVVKVETEFAGVLEIKQALVKSVVTDAPVFVQLADGNTVQGRIEKSGDALRVAGTSGSMQTRTDAIAHIWLPGAKSPAEREADALRRKWVYEAALDLNGKRGNSDRFFFGTSAKATLQGQTDRLFFYGSYAQADENDNKSQDEGKAGGDYSNFFSKKGSWYVRTELGFDATKDLDLRSQSAFGLGYTAIKNEKQNLEFRGGLSYRFEDYGIGEDFDSAGLDLGLLHSYIFGWGKMSNSLSVTPAFDDFGNFVLIHESALELPLAAGKTWKLRVGVKNDYTSEPPAGLEKHDMSYFSQLVFTWQ